MKFKDGVYTRVTKIVNGVETVLHLSDDILAAMAIADDVSKSISGKEMTVTSCLDGSHMTNSKHYSGNAFDMRKRCYNINEQDGIYSELINQLGADFDVVNESTHFHIEYDPK